MQTIPKNASVAVLTGAGISVSSGLAPFRGPGGIWNDADIAELATIEGWNRDPKRVIAFMHDMRTAARMAMPNEAHLSLARAEAARIDGARFDLITQNVDNLHSRAGSKNVHEIHGSLESSLCTRCHRVYNKGDDKCRCGAMTRANVVLFGEALPEDALTDSIIAIRRVVFFVAVGTSGTVAPAAMFAEAAREGGAYCINVNVEKCGNPVFNEELVGEAEQILPWLFGV